MALVNPNIAMSYKPTTEYQPRNVLAEYAQLQQIQGGQRQAEMADMQMQEYRQNKEALGRIQAAIVAKGGPPDLRAAANEMIKNPQYMDKGIQILETLKNQEAMDAYFNPPAAQPTNALAPAGTPTAQTAVAPTALDLPQAGSGIHRTTGALDPSVIQRIGLPPQAGSGIHRATGALDPSVIQRIGLPPQVGSGVQPTNALAPTAQTPVTQAPTNALAPTAPVNQLGADRASIETKIAQLGRINDPRAVAEVKRLERQLTAMEPTPDIKTMTALGYPATREGFEAYRAAQRQEQLTFEQRKELARAGRSVTGGGGGGIDKVVTDESGRTRFFTKTGQEITPTSATGEPIAIQGKPSATFEKTRAQKQQLTKDIDLTINELSEVTKKGGLIDQSTGSGAGRLVDVGARFVGQALPGDIAIGKLQPIADMALKMVPRFEGPQSDKDTASYKEAAGQLANASLPREIRKAAGIEVLRLMKARKNQFVTQNMADEGIAPSTSGAPLAPNIDALVKKYENK